MDEMRSDQYEIYPSQQEGGLEVMIDDLGAGDRVERMRVIANALIEIVRHNSGEMAAEEARHQAARKLNIPSDEVRYGLLFAERTGELIPTNHRTKLKVPSEHDAA